MADVKWIKIYTDMISNKKIKRIRKLPEGNNIVLIWVFLLAQAGECNKSGALYLTDVLPFRPEDLAIEFDFDVSVINFALITLEKFSMIEVFEEIIYIKNWDEYQNIEGMDKIREQTRKRTAIYREKRKQLQLCDVTSDATVTRGDGTELELDLELEKDTTTENGMIQILNEYCKIHNKLDLHLKTTERSAMDDLSKSGIPIKFILESMKTFYTKKIQDGDKITSFLYYPEAITDAWKRKTTVVAFKPNKQSYPMAVGQAISNIDETKDIISEIERLKEEKRKRLVGKKGEDL